MKGYIKLSRSFFDNEIWQAARAFSECEAWLDLIQSARFEASPTTSRIGVYEVTWGRGQYPASNRFLAKKWGRSEQWVKTFLGKLKRKGMITTENSSGINIITLLNFEKYNASDDVEKTPDNPPGNPPSNPLNKLSHSDLQRLVTHLVTQCATHLAENGVKQQPTSSPNKKKEEESKLIESKREAACAATLARRKDFYQSLVPYLGQYPGEMLRDFFDYWSEMNKSQTKMKFEQQPTWELSKRLASWAKREKDYGNPNRHPYPSKQEANEYALRALQERMERRSSGLQDELPKPF